MKKWHRKLNLIMIISVSLTVVRLIVDYVDLMLLRPEVYAMRSAPWYVGGLVYAALTLVVILICMICKAIINRKSGKNPES